MLRDLKKNLIMTKLDFNNEMLIAVDAAKKAGSFLLEERKNINHTIVSSDKDIKLKADTFSEEIIKDIISSKSDLPILAEESGATEHLGNTFWVIDPLDGTANYSRDIPLCCVSVALIFNKKPVLGVIYDFYNDNLYKGGFNISAQLNNEYINVSDTQKRNEGILLTGMPNNSDFSDKSLIEMVSDFQNWRKVRMLGSAAIASTYVASGKADVYSENKSYIWDVAAGAAIVNAAGGEAIISEQNDKFQVDVYFSNALLKKNSVL